MTQRLIGVRMRATLGNAALGRDFVREDADDPRGMD
jgi:hypothetical protein